MYIQRFKNKHGNGYHTCNQNGCVNQIANQKGNRNENEQENANDDDDDVFLRRNLLKKRKSVIRALNKNKRNDNNMTTCEHVNNQ